MSNFILFILLPVRGRIKSARRVGFPFVLALPSLPGNTSHSGYNRSLCGTGIVDASGVLMALLAFTLMYASIIKV